MGLSCDGELVLQGCAGSENSPVFSQCENQYSGLSSTAALACQLFLKLQTQEFW